MLLFRFDYAVNLSKQIAHDDILFHKVHVIHISGNNVSITSHILTRGVFLYCAVVSSLPNFKSGFRSNHITCH